MKLFRALVLPLLLICGLGSSIAAPPQFFDARTYGAVPADCSVDVSAGAQRAIDYVSSIGGGNVQFPPGCYKLNVTLKTGVTLVGQPGTFGYLAGGTPTTRTKFLAAGAGAVIDTPVGSTGNIGVIGIDIQGLGAGAAVKGIHFRTVIYGVIKSVHVNNVADEAILIDSGSIANTIEDVLIFNAVLNRTRAAVIGALDVDGTDHFITRVETGISGQAQGTVQSINLYCVAAAIRMTNGFVTHLLGEFSDVGIYVSGGQNRFVANRADLNYGHGWQIPGSSNQFTSNYGLSNSQDTTNTYDNWNVGGVNNGFIDSLSNFSGGKAPRYHFNDQAPSSDSNKNYWTSPHAIGTAGTAAFNFTAGLSAAWSFPTGSARTLTINSTTPRLDSFGGYTYFQTNNSNPTTITDFPGGVNGQEFTLLVGDSNTTIQHNGATITTPNTGNVKLRVGVHYKFIKLGTWRFAGDHVMWDVNNVSADNGDAAKNIQTRVSEPTQRWNTPLTANRAVTLSTTGVYAGAKFRVVRQAGATGAFTLDVGTGPLKSLAVSQWADFEYNGSAWMLTAFGSL